MGIERLLQLEAEGHFWLGGKQRAILELVRPLRPRRLLDAGCGTGTLLGALARDGIAVAGVDVAPEAVSRCRSVVPGALLVRADAARLPFAAGSFDTALALDVMEHLPEEDDLPREAFRVLAPGGHLVASVPAFRALYGERDRLAGHHRRYRKAEFLAALTSAGFSIRYVNYFNFFLFPLLFLARRFGFEDRPPGKLSNALCGLLLRMEVALARHLPLPWGSTLIAVAEKVRV